MQAVWLDILQSSGATIEDNRVIGYPNTDQPELDAAVYALTDLSILTIKGPDARKFLQGQVTCDINQLNGKLATYGAQCTPKGRAIFNFLATSVTTEQVTLRLPQEMEFIARKSLGKYMVFSKAEMSEAQEYAVVGITGSEASKTLEAVFGHAPTEPLSALQINDCNIICLSEGRYECWIHQSILKETWQKLTSQAPVAATKNWHALDIQSGISNIYLPTTEEFVPQTINMGQIGAISFTKGCYTGQEVVARMQYLGKQKRYTYRARYVGSKIPQPGENLLTESAAQTIGKVVSAAHIDDETYELLVCITQAAFEQGNVCLAEDTGNCIEFLELPYPIEQKEEKPKAASQQLI